MPKIYVKKLVSLNPKRYEFIEIEKALEKYMLYNVYCYPNYKPKSFKQWLTTEI